jgi:hypothetical protein
VWGFLFSHILISICCLFSWWLAFWPGDMESQCSFDLHFLYS